MKYIFAVALMWFTGCQTQQERSPQATPEVKKDTAQPASLEPSDIKTKGSEIVLTEEERIWELIPWTTDLKEATRLSEETERPIFLFSMHGDLDGRC